MMTLTMEEGVLVVTFRFHFNTDLPHQLRVAINEKQDISLKKEAVLKNAKTECPAWDRICAIMDRLEDTISYINILELGAEEKRSAFDFYEFISCAAVVIDCIRYIGNIFDVDPNLIRRIEDTQEVFGCEYAKDGTDRKFFEYIRSLCVTHPIETNHQPEYLQGSKFHCCPFVTWSHFGGGLRHSGDLHATVYTSCGDGYGIHIPLYVNQFERYLGKWIDHIGNVIDAIHNYNEGIYDEFRRKPVKHLYEFKSIVEYLQYLQAEYSQRFGDYNSYIFEEHIRVFRITLTNPHNQALLEKYKNAIIYSLTFVHNSLQNMSQEGAENTGIVHKDPNAETELFVELTFFSNENSVFSPFSYHLQKAYNLDPRSHSSCYDKQHAKGLLEEVKDSINQFVIFKNNESDEETVVLITLAKYFDALNGKTLLNKNIPNEEQYRIQCLSEEEWEELLLIETDEEDDAKDFDWENIVVVSGEEDLM